MDAKPPPAAEVASSAKIYVSPGVKTILQAGAAEKTERGLREAPPGADFWPFIRALLVVTDVLLLALCGLLVWRSAGAMTLWEALGCTLAVGMGAALMCASILVGQDGLSLRWKHQAAATNGRGAAERT